MSKTYVIGDIHGALKAVHQILERAPVKQDDTLIFLGDFVDGWSESGEVIELMFELQEEYNCVFIKGNHDVILLDYLKTGKVPPMWLHHGGQASIESYQNNSFDRKAHINFMERLKNYYIDDENRLFVHAGFTSTQGPQKEKYEYLLYWDRTLWETAVLALDDLSIESPYYPARFKLFKEIYIGHSSVLKFGTDQPMNQFNLWNLDTGAAYTGKLTIMDVDTKEIWQSDPVWELYADEKGRNERSFRETFSK